MKVTSQTRATRCGAWLVRMLSASAPALDMSGLKRMTIPSPRHQSLTGHSGHPRYGTEIIGEVRWASTNFLTGQR